MLDAASLLILEFSLLCLQAEKFYRAPGYVFAKHRSNMTTPEMTDEDVLPALLEGGKARDRALEYCTNIGDAFGTTCKKYTNS